jgi:hypothetical protein
MTNFPHWHLTSRLVGMSILALGAVLATAVIAFAAHPVKGATYSGTVKQGNILITFHVSSDGKKVTKLRPNSLPLFCQGGGGPTVLKFKNARVSSKGKFKTTGTETANGKLIAKASVTGKFLTQRREKGSLKVTYTHAPDCSGSTTYTTATSARPRQ